MNLEQLIKSCIKKNRKGQEELYNTYKKKLFPVCLKYCRTQTEAEDLLHDVFIEIFDKIKKYQGQGSFEGWMKRIAINKAIDRYKKNKVYGLDDKVAEQLTEDVKIAQENLPPSVDVLMFLIQELPNQYRIVFNLYELDGFPHKKIAEMLGISEGTSKSNLHRAKSILKEKVLMLKKERMFNPTNGHG